MTIRYQCDTQQGKCYRKEYMQDWDILAGCFPGLIRPADIDGAVEINGHVLFLEWKGPGVTLSSGQRIMFQTMTRDAPKQRVVVLFGKPGKPESASLFYRGERVNRAQYTLDELRIYCKQWADWATKDPLLSDGISQGNQLGGVRESARGIEGFGTAQR